jgi:hypothetical protein
MQFIYGIIIILAITGMYQTIYVLNKYVSFKNKAERDRIIKNDINTFSTCCGNPGSCTLPAKIEKTIFYKKDIEVLNDVTAKDIQEALNLDEKVYKKSTKFDIEKCLNWHNKNNKIYVMIRDKYRGKIIGYINFAPVNDESYEKILSRKFSDIDMDDNSILAYDKPGKYKIYFTSMVIQEKYRGTEVFGILMDGLMKRIEELFVSGMIVDKIVADAVSFKGRKVCDLLGMKQIGEQTNRNSYIYELTNLTEIKPKSEAMKKVIKLYKRYSEGI